MGLLDGLDILLDIFRQDAYRMSISRGRVGHPFSRYPRKKTVPGWLAGKLVLAQATTEKAMVGAPASGHVVKEAGIRIGNEQRVLKDAKPELNWWNAGPDRTG